MIWPKLTPMRKFFLAFVFFGPGLAAWLPFLAGMQKHWWVAALIHLVATSSCCLIYFFNWRSDDKLLGVVEKIRNGPRWHVWLVSEGRRELLTTVYGTREGAYEFGQNELMHRCWDSELGIVAGTVEVEPAETLQ